MAKSRPDAAASRKAHPEIAAIERPNPAGTNAPGFGSDVVAETLRDLDIPYIALNPGASYRGLHDCLVNYLGNTTPQMLLCLHEEAAVAIAHGYAKVTGQRDGGGRAFQCRADARHHGDLQRLVRPHAGDRARRDRPGRRRQAPALDRLDPHRARPGRAGAQLHQMGRPARLARPPRAKRCCAPAGSPTLCRKGPVYINLDAEMQEAKLAEPLPPLDVARFMPPVAAGARAGAVAQGRRPARRGARSR